MFNAKKKSSGSSTKRAYSHICTGGWIFQVVLLVSFFSVFHPSKSDSLSGIRFLKKSKARCMPIVRLFGTEESVLLEFEVLQTQLNRLTETLFLVVATLLLFASSAKNIKSWNWTKVYLVIIKRDIMFARIRTNEFIRRVLFSLIHQNCRRFSGLWTCRISSNSLCWRKGTMLKKHVLKQWLHSSTRFIKIQLSDSGLNWALPEGPQSKLQRWKGWPTDTYCRCIQ